MSARGALFDAAGTLFELREPVGETYARFAAEQGVSLPAARLGDAYRRVMARAAPMIFPDVTAAEVRRRERAWWQARVRETFLAADSAMRPPKPDGLFDALFAHYAGSDAWAARPGAAAGLAELRAAGWRVGIASNFDHRLLDLLEALGLHREIDSITQPYKHGLGKPDRAFFAAALADLGCEAAETVYVGDDPNLDLAAARRAGLRAAAADTLGDWRALPARLDALATLGRRGNEAGA